MGPVTWAHACKRHGIQPAYLPRRRQAPPMLPLPVLSLPSRMHAPRARCTDEDLFRPPRCCPHARPMPMAPCDLVARRSQLPSPMAPRDRGGSCSTKLGAAGAGLPRQQTTHSRCRAWTPHHVKRIVMRWPPHSQSAGHQKKQLLHGRWAAHPHRGLQGGSGAAPAQVLHRVGGRLCSFVGPMQQGARLGASFWLVALRIVLLSENEAKGGQKGWRKRGEVG